MRVYSIVKIGSSEIKKAAEKPAKKEEAKKETKKSSK